MSKNMTDILNLCNKIGLFKINFDGRVFYGPYGQAILSQIKNLWLKSTLNRNENVHLIDSNKKTLDTKYYFKSLMEQFRLKNSNFSLIHIDESENGSMFNFGDYLFIRTDLKHTFNYYYFLMDNDYNNQKLLYWQQLCFCQLLI